MSTGSSLRRGGWAVLGAGAVVAAAVIGSPWLLLAWLVPDLGVLAGGIHLVRPDGELTRAARIGYNSTHTLFTPVLLGGLALATTIPWMWAVTVLWFSHIAVDRALGYRLRPLHE